MLSVINLLIVIAGIAALILAGYYIIYTIFINKKVSSGDQNGHAMVALPKIIITIVIVVLLLFCLTLIRGLRSAEQGKAVNRDNYNVIDISDENDYSYLSVSGYVDTEDLSIVSYFNRDDNPGYKKEVTSDGDFTFTSFTRISGGDNMLPDFVCYVDYTGKDQEKLAMYINGEFSDADSSIGASGIGGGDICKSMLVLGNIDEDENFTLEISLLDSEAEQKYADADAEAYKEDKGNFPAVSDFASSNSRLVIAK